MSVKHLFTLRVLSIFVLWLVIGAQSAHADPAFDFIESWTNSPDLEGWDAGAPYGAGDATLENPAGEYLRITWPTSAFPVVREDTIFTTGNASYTGDYTRTSLGLSFQFYAETVVPSPSDALVWMLASDGTQWERPITQSGLGWETHVVTFSYSDGWQGGSSADFLNDIPNIVSIGVYVSAETTGGAAFGIDDWGYLYVPEPGTFFMLTAALMSLGITLKGRFRSIFKA